MDVQVIQRDPVWVVMLRHVGPYDELSGEFDRLYEWTERHGVEWQRPVGIYWDNADHVPAKNLRSAACVEVPPHYIIPSRDGLPMEVGEIAGGNYATTRFVGSYDGLAAAWSQMTSQIENAMGLTVREDDPAFEVYVNDPSDTPASGLITELFMPVG